jgi:hypothetical protein
MKSWLSQWFTARAARPRSVLFDAVSEPTAKTLGAQGAPAALRSGPPPMPMPSLDADLAFLAWMTDGRMFAVGPAGPREAAALSSLDRLLADTAAHANLLPRAAAVIPPLLARLRSPGLSLAELSKHVSRDVTLVAEIIRAANSVHYRSDAVVADLDRAMQLLGIEGLRSVIARAVLRPLIDQRNGPLAASGATRLWEHTDKKAQLCSALARGAALDPFEACMAGLAHNAVWSALLRTLNKGGGEGLLHLSPDLLHALLARRDCLFAVVARQWHLAGFVVQAGTDGASHEAADESSAAMRLLHSSDRLAWLLCMPDRQRAAALAEPRLREADEGLRACYHALEPPHRPPGD